LGVVGARESPKGRLRAQQAWCSARWRIQLIKVVVSLMPGVVEWLISDNEIGVGAYFLCAKLRAGLFCGNPFGFICSAAF
jgi:hypothetical protein